MTLEAVNRESVAEMPNRCERMKDFVLETVITTCFIAAIGLLVIHITIGPGTDVWFQSHIWTAVALGAGSLAAGLIAGCFITSPCANTRPQEEVVYPREIDGI